MNGPQEPPEVRSMIQVEEALVGLIRGRDVHESETDPRRNLKDKENERRAPKDIPEACRAARHRVSKDRRERRADPRALLQPFRDCTHESHAHPPKSHGFAECRNLAATHVKPPVAHRALVLKETPRWRSRGARSVFVVHAAVAWAHE